MSKILVADDDTVVCDSIRLVLESKGHSVECVHNGDAAIELAESGRFDAALVDLIMPGRSGFEVMSAIAGHDRPRIVAMSAGGPHHDDYLLQQSTRFGAVGVLQKPFYSEQLIGAIEQALVRPSSGLKRS